MAEEPGDGQQKKHHSARLVTKKGEDHVNHIVILSKCVLFPRKKVQQQKTGFAGHYFSLGNIDGFEGVNMSYLQSCHYSPGNIHNSIDAKSRKKKGASEAAQQ